MSRQNAILLPLGLAAILTIGFAIVIGFIAGWLISVWETGKQRKYVYENLQVLLDGTPVIYKHDSNIGISEYRTLDGEKIEITSDYDYFSHSYSLVGPSYLKTQKIRGPLEARNRIIGFSDQLFQASYWYFIHDGNIDGKGYFIGYDSKHKRCIGYIGRSGFSQDIPSSDNWFPMEGREMGGLSVKSGIYPRTVNLWEPEGRDSEESDFPSWKVVMISGDELLQIDLRTRSVNTLMKLPNMLSLWGIDAFIPMPDKPIPDEMRSHYLAVRTLDKIILFDAAGKQVRSYVIPEDLRNPTFTFYDLGDEKALIARNRFYQDLKEGSQLTWIDTSGKILRQEEVILAGRELKSYSKAENWKGALILPGPIAPIFISLLAAPILYLDAEVETTYADALSRSLPDIWLPLAATCILGAVLAWICYRRQQRMALPWTWVWVVFVFLCGVPGFLGYLFHRRWPVMENCPACGKNVPHDRKDCSSCGTEFPLPAPKGIEVFA